MIQPRSRLRRVTALVFAALLVACAQAPASSGPGGGDPCAVYCGDLCCAVGESCVPHPPGQICAAYCSDSSGCPSSAPCCGTFVDGTSACVPDDGATVCRCQAGAQCASGYACAPGENLSNPEGYLVCSPDDGKLYDGCERTGSCVSPGDCCVLDGAGNHFCVPMDCTTDAECGANFHCYPAICAGQSVCAP